jgi:plastocyanin
MRLLALIGLVLTLGGCSMWGMEGGPGGSGAAAPTVATGQSPVDAVVGSDGIQRVEVTMGDDLRLHPALVRARPGVIVFTFHNTGATPHDIEFPGLARGTGNLNGDASVTVRLTAREPGTYPFSCVYHQSSGMQGTLVVQGITASG